MIAESVLKIVFTLINSCTHHYYRWRPKNRWGITAHSTNIQLVPQTVPKIRIIMQGQIRHLMGVKITCKPLRRRSSLTEATGSCEDEKTSPGQKSTPSPGGRPRLNLIYSEYEQRFVRKACNTFLQHLRGFTARLVYLCTRNRCLLITVCTPIKKSSPAFFPYTPHDSTMLGTSHPKVPIWMGITWPHADICPPFLPEM